MRHRQEPKKENSWKNFKEYEDEEKKKRKMNVRKTQQAPAHGGPVKDKRGKKTALNAKVTRCER